MDERFLHESGVMLIRANRALIRGGSMLPDGSGPYFLPIGAGCGQASMLQSIEGGNQMKGFKKSRNIKIYGMSGYNYKSTPTIMLKGQWLKELGFEIGGYVTVSCENGRLVITPDAEMAAMKEAEAAFMERETKILHKKFEAEKEKLCAQFVAERSREYNSSTEQEA